MGKIYTVVSEMTSRCLGKARHVFMGKRDRSSGVVLRLVGGYRGDEQRQAVPGTSGSNRKCAVSDVGDVARSATMTRLSTDVDERLETFRTEFCLSRCSTTTGEKETVASFSVA